MAANNDGWEDAPVSASSDGWEDAPAAKHLDRDEVTAAVRKQVLTDMFFGHKEAALNMVSGTPGALGGGLNFLGTLAATGNLDAASSVQHDTEKAINDKIQYNPRTEAGKRGEKDIQGAMHKIIEAGGPAFSGLTRAIPFVGEDLANDNKDATDAIGKAYAEMAMNVVDPLIAVKGLKGFKGGEKLALEHADKLEPKLEDKGWEDAPAQPVAPTQAHADDFAAMNPYDVGGHVSASEQGHPATIDNPQGDLFGGENLQPTQAGPNMGQNSLIHGTIPYEKTFPFDLVPKDGAAPHEMGLNMPEHDPGMALQPDQNFMKLGENTWEGSVGSRDAAAAKAAEQARAEQHMQQGMSKEDAFAKAEQETAAAKDRDFNHMEAQKQLDFAAEAERVQNSPARNFFTDPRNRDKLDHQFASENVGDKSLMHPEATQSMVDALRKGDIHGALDSIVKNHIDPAYRNLAEYLKGVVGDVNLHMHDEGILEMGDRHATGYYDPTSHTVGLSKVGAVSPHTVLHELVHSITSHFVNDRPNDLRVTGLKDLFNKLNEMGMGKEFPEVSNVKEFLAEAFSNPEFQGFLKEHKLYDRSTWRRFMDNVKSLLGFSSGTRNHITNALEHVMDLGKQIAEVKDDPKAPLTDAGVPSKLADLMVVRDRPTPSRNPNVSKLQVPGLKDAISDFKFDDRPMHEIIAEAREGVDIPNTALEKIAQQMQAGGLFESLKTRNPVVKATFERVQKAVQEFSRDIKNNLTDPKDGLKAFMRAMTPDEKGQVHNLMMLNEGVRELSNLDLRKAGMNEKQVAFYNKYREQSKKFLDDINARRKDLGMDPIDERVAHMAGRFMGDFARFVFDAEGKIVGRISGSTRMELNKVTKYMQEQHPEWQMGKEDYNGLGKGRNPADRFQGLTEALNFLTKTNTDFSALMESYKGYIQKDAVGYLNAVRHAKAKVNEPGGIKGSEGNKPWLDAVKNADEGMKAQLAYFEQGYKWMAMEKAVKDLQPLLGDKDINLNTPNAVKWGRDYLNHALGREQGKIADAANWTASMIGDFTGIGHSNIFKANAMVKHAVMQKFMGLGNIPFSITQMMQPFQVHPPMMALLKARGLEINPFTAQMKAASTHLNMLSKEATGKHSAFERAALDYAHDAGIMDVQMADHSKDINVSKIGEAYSKIADMNIEIPEKLTRGTSYLFYAHLLKDAGVPIKDIFGAAENLTNFTMVNYHPVERPMGYAKLGWLGDLASTLTRYKHNQLSQAAFYTREGIHNGNLKSYAPLATFLATSLAFGGVMGFFGYNEADAAYQLASKAFGKPDTLTGVLFKHNTPELITHGLFSTLGLDMTTRFSNANVLPDSIPKALLPYGSAVLDMAQAGLSVAGDPTSATKWKQFGKAVAPQSVSGLLENQLFTHKTPDGRNLYVNNTDGPNFGKGRVYRDDKEMALRNFGFRSIGESKELAKNYSDSQINKGQQQLAQGLLNQIKYDSMDGKLTPEKLAAYANKAATQYDMDPGHFANEVVKWMQASNMSQAEQIKFRNAMGGFTGAMRMKEGR